MIRKTESTCKKIFHNQGRRQDRHCVGVGGIFLGGAHNSFILISNEDFEHDFCKI